MSHNEIKAMYDIMVKNKELLDLFPYLDGDWEEDKEDFISSYNGIEDLMDSIDLDDEY